jgi:hypothetical protein
VLQVGVVGYYLFHVGFDLVVIVVDDLLHHVVSCIVGKFGYDGDWPVGFCFG